MSKFVHSGQQIGNVQLEHRIWDGSFSTTWRAKTKDGQTMIVQVIENERLRQELQEHPLIRPNFSNRYMSRLIAIHDNPFCLIWQYLAGRRLSTYIQQLKVIKPNIALYITRRILELMQFLHSKGFVYGALRPTRVLVSPDKKVLLTNYPIGQ